MPLLETLGGLLGSPETLNAENNSEASVNKQAGNLAKYKDKWSLFTKNHFVLEIASQCKIDFINDSPPVQICPQCELHFSEQESSVIDAELSKLLSRGVIMCAIYCKKSIHLKYFHKAEKQWEIQTNS